MPESLPIVSFKKLWHVGEIDITKKRPGSHEGQGLSVSTHPDAWEQINSFTYGPHWELTKPGNQFLAFHKMSKPQRQMLYDWGIQQGYVESVSLWRTMETDENGERAGYFEFDNVDKALEQAGYDSLEQAQRDGAIKENKKGFKPTPKFDAKMGEKVSQAFVLDFLAVIYAEEVLNLDGVWWADRLSIEEYSAPRGVIFNSMLASWHKRKVKTGAKHIQPIEDLNFDDCEKTICSRTRPVSDFKEYYHGTTDIHYNFIKLEGLKAGSYVTTDRYVAINEAKESVSNEFGLNSTVTPLVIAIDGSKLNGVIKPDPEYVSRWSEDEDKIWEDITEWIIEEPIPNHAIREVKKVVGNEGLEKYAMQVEETPQIKSAIGNNGEFNAKDTRITASCVQAAAKIASTFGTSQYLPSWDEFTASLPASGQLSGIEALIQRENLTDHFGDESDEDEEDGFSLLKFSVGKLKERYLSLQKFYAQMKFPLDIYRGLQLDEQYAYDEEANEDKIVGYSPIDFNHAGRSWTWDKGAAGRYDGSHMETPTHILHAKVPESSVNWNKTLNVNLLLCDGPIEKEITLKKGAELFLVDVEEVPTKTVTPMNKTITAMQVEETPFNKRYRRKSGYTKLVLINAAKFKALFEEQRGEKLDWNPGRLERLAPLDSVDDYPKIYMDSNGKVDVLDGRHRITTAANRGENIWCATRPYADFDYPGLCLEVKKAVFKTAGFYLTLYRGEGPGTTRNGRFWSPDANFARQFTRQGLESELLIARLHSSEIYKATNLPYGGDEDLIDAVVGVAKEKGYTAVWCSEGGSEPNSVYVFDNSKLHWVRRRMDIKGSIKKASVVRAYHGTMKDFDTFQTPAMFHVRRKYCEDLAPDGRIIEAILTINNPADLDALHISPSDPNFKEITKVLEDEGYDGAQYKNEAWVAFNLEQIKVINSKAAAKYPTPEGITFKITGSVRYGFLINANLQDERIDERIGYILLKPYNHVNQPGDEVAFFVGAVKVIDEFRERGVGLLLYKEAIKLAQKKGAVRLYQGIPRTPAADNMWIRLKREYPVQFDKQSQSEFISLKAKTASTDDLEYIGRTKIANVTETPAFKAWFAGSEVVDTQGKPLVMYHATTSDIGEFHAYTHFGTQDAANDRYQNLTEFYNDTLNNPGRAKGSNIMPVYLSVKNALRMPDLANIDANTGEVLPEWTERTNEKDEDTDRYPRGWEGEEAIPMTLYEMGIMDIDDFEEHRSNAKALQFLEQQGYDGIVYTNVVEDPGNDSWIVFHPNQVKSAIGNNGGFDSNQTSITARTTKIPMKALEKELRELREAEGEGQCYQMAEILGYKYGWENMAGFYFPDPKLTDHEHHADHAWNETKDGILVDATHDQFGAPDILVLQPGDPKMAHYHAYCGDYNCPICTCEICNESFAEEARKAKTAKAEIMPQKSEIDRDESAVPKRLPSSPQQAPQQSPEKPVESPQRPKTPVKKREPKQKPYVPPVENKAFKSWFGKSKVVNSAGQPLVVYHGTTHNFDTFSPEKGNKENHYGIGFYFTSSQQDVSKNYTNMGPDLKSRIENEAERLMQDWEFDNTPLPDDFQLLHGGTIPGWEDMNNEERIEEFNGLDRDTQLAAAKKEVTKELVGGDKQGLVMPCYLRMVNPVIVAPKGGTSFQLMDEGVYNEELDEYEYDDDSTNPLYDAIEQTLGSAGGELWGEIYDRESITAYEFEKILRASSVLYEDDIMNEGGPGPVISNIYQRLGYDGIIQKNAEDAFNLSGMGYNVTHFIVWKPEQIKSALGNTGKFDKKNPSITASEDEELGTKLSSQSDITDLVSYLTMNEKDRLETFANTFFEEWMEGHEEAPADASIEDLFEFYEYNYRIMMYERPEDCPAFMFMEYIKTISNSWVLHYTDYAESIVQEGFTKGVNDINRLGLTFQIHPDDKAHGGYSFGFPVNNPKDLEFISKIEGQANYGSHAVLTKANSVIVRHLTDGYIQAVFWGADATRKRIPILAKNGGWAIGEQQFSTMVEAVQWAKANQRPKTAYLFSDYESEEERDLFKVIVNEQGLNVEIDNQGVRSAVLTSPTTLHHATRKDRLDEVLRKGLEPRSKGKKLFLGTAYTPSPLLYHGTSMSGIVGILKDNAMYEGVHWGRKGEPHGVRLTRSKPVAERFAIEGLIGHPSEGAVIEFDGNALAQDFKLVDYTDVDCNGGEWSEPEDEVVVVRKKIPNIRKYIKAIYLKDFDNQQDINDYAELVEEEGRGTASEWLAGYAKLLKDPLVKGKLPKTAATLDSHAFSTEGQGKTAKVKYIHPAHYIKVPESAQAHFWQKTAPRTWEFWAFRSRPRMLKGEKLIFTFGTTPVAETRVAFIEEPGKSSCEETGKFEDYFKVFWNPKDFKKYKVDKTAAKDFSWSQEEMVREAEQYRDGAVYSEGMDLNSLNWKYEPNFNLHQIDGFDQGDYDELDSIMQSRVEDIGYEQSYVDELKESIKSGTVDPIVVVQHKNGKFLVWDGNHRVGMASILKKDSLPAIVGHQTPKKYKTKAASTDDEIAKAKAFFIQKWSERAKELGREEPKNLTGACKFASLFVQALFGGEIQGNKNHQFNVLPDGQRVDLTAGSTGSEDYTHDKKFFGNPDHVISMESCMPRVQKWVEDYRNLNRDQK